jgi:outer membrane protein TolC
MRAKFVFSPGFSWTLLGVLALSLRSAAAEPGPVLSRDEFVREVLQRSPARRAAEAQARVADAEARVASALPEPELMVDIKQVPLERPYAIDRAGMFELGLKQHVSAPGSLGRRRTAREQLARRAREIGRLSTQNAQREAGFAFVDYAVSTELVRLQEQQRALLTRLEQSMALRFQSGSSPLDAASVAVEGSRIGLLEASAQARLEAARGRMNALLGRAPDSELPPPTSSGAETVTVSAAELLALARKQRPELRAAGAEIDAAAAERAASEREASVPSFDLAALYYPKIGMQSEHGYGVSASMSLPWLWGARRSELEVAAARHDAALAEQRSLAQALETEALAALGEVKASTARLTTLQGGLRSGVERQVALGESRLASGVVALPALLEARRALLLLDVEIVEARGELERALIDLDFAAGGRVPRAGLAVSLPASVASKRSP